MKSVEMRQKAAALVAEMRGILDGAQGNLTDEQQTVWNEKRAAYDKLNTQITLVETQEQMELASTRSTGTLVGAAGGTEQRQAPAVLKHGRGDSETRAWAHYLRTGDTAALAESRAYNNTDMNIGTAADGGYAVPTGLYNEIIAKRDEQALFPKLGVRQIGGKGLTVRVPIDNEADVLFTVETEAASLDQDAPALYYKDFTLAKYAKYLTLSWELLRDEDANLMAFINDWVARGIAATENSLLMTEVLANGTAGLTLDAAAAIGETEIPEMVGKLTPEYQMGAAWILNPSTFAYIQGVGGTNVMKFMPSVTISMGGTPTLWGYPVHQSSYASAHAASAKSLVFGNFYFLGRRQGTSIQMLRDPYTAAGTGQVKLWFWFDCVYGVLQAEAIQYATHPSA